MFKSKRALMAVASKRSILAFIVVLLISIAQPCQAGTFFDNFNDGNADGWVFPYGNWQVENGMLVQTLGGDDYIALVKNLQISTQSIETQVSTGGYGGVIFWYKGNSYINVYAYPSSYGLRIQEIIDGVVRVLVYSYPTAVYQKYKLRVDADSATRKLEIYIDNSYIFTYYASTPYRTGLSGVFAGNALGYFDDFSVTSNDISPVPKPVTIDIQPDRINPKSNGKIEVAILSTNEFNSPEMVDIESLTFGRTGRENSLAFCDRNAKDINRDGLQDLVCHFYTQDAGFQCLDTDGILRGKTVGGTPIAGSDSVKIAPCH